MAVPYLTVNTSVKVSIQSKYLECEIMVNLSALFYLTPQQWLQLSTTNGGRGRHKFHYLAYRCNPWDTFMEGQAVLFKGLCSTPPPHYKRRPATYWRGKVLQPLLLSCEDSACKRQQLMQYSDPSLWLTNHSTRIPMCILLRI